MTRQRGISVHLRLNGREYRNLVEQAKAAGMTRTQYIRALIDDPERQPVPPHVLAELRRQLAAVGNNLNQIIRAASTCGTIRQEDADAILTMRDELWQYLERI